MDVGCMVPGIASSGPRRETADVEEEAALLERLMRLS